MLRALTRPVGVRHRLRAFSCRNPDQQADLTNKLCATALTATFAKKLTRFELNKQAFSHLNVLGSHYHHPHSSHWRMNELLRVRPLKIMGGESIHMLLSGPGFISPYHFTLETGSSSSPQNGNTSLVKYAIALLFLCTSGICAIWPHVKDLLEGSENWNVIELPSSLVNILLKSFTVNAAKPFIDDNENPVFNQGAKNKNDQGLSRRQRFNFIADVLEMVESAVVCIEVKDHSTASWYGVPQASSNGSGFIVKEDGLILTNAHVVASQQRNSITVKLNDGRCFAGFIEDVDYESDLATVRVKARGLPTLQLGCSSETRIGEWVVAVGSPLNLSNTVTAGVVSSTKRGAVELGIENDITYIQTDAAITFGNSGGPLINLDGEAVGINSMKVAPGISFAIPIDRAKKFLQRAETRRVTGKSKASRRYMGLTILTLTDQIRKELEVRSGTSVPIHGVFVWQVVRGGPAFLSGLQPGDVITNINGRQIMSAAQVHEIIKTDDELVVEIQRWGKRHKLTIVPENVMQ